MMAGKSMWKYGLLMVHGGKGFAGRRTPDHHFCTDTVSNGRKKIASNSSIGVNATINFTRDRNPKSSKCEYLQNKTFYK